MVSFASPTRPRNWTCACAPGLLGPPPSIIPPAVRVIVESSASGLPLDWKMSVTPKSSVITINWRTNQAVLSAKPLQYFPPALLSALDLICPPSPSWCIDMANNLLTCEISWSTSTSPPTPTSCLPKVLPSSPDSGYLSPTSSINTDFPPSPIPLVFDPPVTDTEHFPAGDIINKNLTTSSPVKPSVTSSNSQTTTTPPHPSSTQSVPLRTATVTCAETQTGVASTIISTTTNASQTDLKSSSLAATQTSSPPASRQIPSTISHAASTQYDATLVSTSATQTVTSYSPTTKTASPKNKHNKKSRCPSSVSPLISHDTSTSTTPIPTSEQASDPIPELASPPGAIPCPECNSYIHRDRFPAHAFNCTSLYYPAIDIFIGKWAPKFSNPLIIHLVPLFATHISNNNKAQLQTDKQYAKIFQRLLLDLAGSNTIEFLEDVYILLDQLVKLAPPSLQTELDIPCSSVGRSEIVVEPVSQSVSHPGPA